MKNAVMSAACNTRTLAVSVCSGCDAQNACSARRAGFYANAVRFFAYCIFYYYNFTDSAHQPKGTQATTWAVAL